MKTNDPVLRRMMAIAKLLEAKMEFPSGGTTFVQSTSFQSAYVATAETTATTASYGDLATVGPSVTLAPGPNSIACIVLGAFCSNPTSGHFGLFSVAASGGNVVAASDANAIQGTSFTGGVGETASGLIVLTGLAVASTTFTLKYKSSGGTQTFSGRGISVLTY